MRSRDEVIPSPSYGGAPRASSLWAAALLLAACGCPEGEAWVAVESAERALEVCAELALTEEERRRGLMGHPPLAPGEGMYFDFRVEQEICIFNGGVTFPIDVLYADADGEIVAIEREVPAGDETPRCHPSTMQVLEVGAGELAAFDPGDRLVFR